MLTAQGLCYYGSLPKLCYGAVLRRLRWTIVKDANSNEVGRLIRFDDVQFAYPAGPTLAAPTWEVAEGRRVLMTGPSGGGKTTLLNLAAGLLRPLTGDVYFENQSLPAMSSSQRRRLRLAKIGMVFQSFELLEHLSVLDNLMLPCRLDASIGIHDEVNARARMLADALGIGHLLSRLPSKISRGEQQRVAVGRALVLKPKLVLADEPLSSLDHETKHRVFAVFSEHAQGTTLVMASHLVDVASEFDESVDVRDLLAEVVGK